ncbi:hypothetical protein [Chitinophaga sp. S165]|uniref:hypothetical protein n=1 Tax=Chitinophaga sp. S165 TaxID=2135462 RepID=UPI000D718FE2|nr:hypothetical protein [Chitinophaga sp. S165]PWV53257.1 hypothetical protein C7475_1023 [Chitinophaga sp. S165]
MQDILDGNNEKEFEERSDNIKDDDLEIWNIENGHFQSIQRKLMGAGAKLLAGPRGTGKTHQMRLTYSTCVNDFEQSSKPVAIFATFGRYYYLEPMLGKASNAFSIFHAWVLAKILKGCYEYLAAINKSDLLTEIQNEYVTAEELDDFIAGAELARYSELNTHTVLRKTSISYVTRILEFVAMRLDKTRVVLLLDDAALTFTPDYLVEFFDIYRSLKSKIISPKASVYPGTTEYGPRFHVGQDAELVNCWLSINDSAYGEFMDSLIDKRFNQYKVTIPNTILEIYKYASFGIPRAFISLLRRYKDSTESSSQAKFNKSIEAHIQYIDSEYHSLEQKIPQFKLIIETGYLFFRKIITDLVADNKEQANHKSIVIGIDDRSLSVNRMSERMLRFLTEAGLLYSIGIVKHGNVEDGDSRNYRRYIPHIIFLIKERAFSTSRGFNPQEILDKLNQREKKHPLRRTLQTLLSNNELTNLRLDLPPCQSCRSIRLTEEQKFCHVCGTQLVKPSAFEACMVLPINVLSISPKIQQRLKKELSIHYLKDIIALQHPKSELQSVKYIGTKRSEQIIDSVRTTVDEFLS